MISERDIAEKFNSIWKHNFPFLTPSFIRVFNESYVKKINEPIPISNDIRYDLVAEYSYQLTKESFETEKSISELNKSRKDRDVLIKKVVKTIWKNENYDRVNVNTSTDEFKEAELLANNTTEFIKIMNPKNIDFELELKGSGFMQNVFCDISMDDCIVEIKTVNRNFRSSDLKQLFLYLALQYVSGNRDWKYGCLYNPRKGVFCKFKVSSIVYTLTGGKSSLEVFNDLLNSFNREVQIDKRF